MSNYDDYTTRKKDFLKKHELLNVFTSSLDQYDRYHKEYVCEGNAIFYEVCGPIWETPTYKNGELEIVGDPVKMFQVEYWDTDNSNSGYYKEKY